jgi:cobalamin biosynthesis protein CobT
MFVLTPSLKRRWKNPDTLSPATYDRRLPSGRVQKEWLLALQTEMVCVTKRWEWDMDFKGAAERTGYTIYTTEFDEIRDIREEYTQSNLEHLRDEAEGYVRYGGPPTTSDYHYKRDAEELDRAISEFTDTIRNAVSESGVNPSATVIGFLMDNSGSVRNLRPVYARAMHRVCAALEEIGFNTTVVGHTTARWIGGQARQKWLESSRAPTPGRLNDLLITVYKEPDEPIVEGDVRLYGLNSPSETYKENIDGEALAWMAEQMAEMDVQSRSLIFVSDGDFPCDDSTLSCHPADYLLEHRNAVIEEITTASDISLVQVVATEGELMEAKTDMPRFGGVTKRSSELVRAIGQAVDHSLRMRPAPERKPPVTTATI